MCSWRIRSRRASSVLGLAVLAVLGTVACPASHPHVHGPFLVNHSGTALMLSVEWLEAEGACSAPLAQLGAALPAASSAVYAFRLESTQTARLSGPPGEGGSNVARCPNDAERRLPVDAAPGAPSCVLLRISGDELAPHLVRADRYWESTDARTQCAPRVPVYENPGQGALVIRDDGDGRALTAHAHIEALRL